MPDEPLFLAGCIDYKRSSFISHKKSIPFDFFFSRCWFVVYMFILCGSSQNQCSVHVGCGVVEGVGWGWSAGRGGGGVRGGLAFCWPLCTRVTRNYLSAVEGCRCKYGPRTNVTS